ncbi:MAG: ABC transporter ATP-binding protein [Gemmatimonadales bacterium]|jgi:putative ABC transport system ATP-binding protein
MSMIELECVARSYQKVGAVVRALNDVSLVIESGEFVAVLGPSGSGKSTLLNILGLLDRPHQGVYRLGGRDVNTYGADELAALRNRRIGFVFQTFHLLPKTPAIENVELPLIYSDRSNPADLAIKALDRVGLTERASHHPGELSGGQQQRVAIARALVNEPDLILADEPTGNLDSRSGLEIMAILQDLNAEGVTVVLVTHDAELARMATRRIEIIDGRIAGDEAVTDRLAADALLGVAVDA